MVKPAPFVQRPLLSRDDDERLSAADAAPGLSMLDLDAEHRSPSRGSRLAKAAVVASDAVAVASAMVLAALGTAVLSPDQGAGPILVLSGLALPLWLGVFARYKLYTSAAVTSFPAEFSRVLHAVAAATVITALIETASAARISRTWLPLLFSIGLLAVLTERGIVRLAFRLARSRGQLTRRVVVIGTNSEALGVVSMLRTAPGLGYDVVGLLDSDTAYGVVAPVPVLGHWNDAVHLMREVDATGVIIVASAIDVPLANRLARELLDLGYHVEITSGLVDIAASRLIARPLGRRPVMYIEPVHRLGWRAVAKRVFDIAVATGGLIVLSPILLATAIAIKLDSRGSVFFHQERVGKNALQFGVVKFRTMQTGAEGMLADLRLQNEADGPLFKMRNDPRVTRVGRFLRKWSIDELPQLFNVLRGEMSIVGPRPVLPSEVLHWPADLQNRLRVKPGITGMWQVNGRSSASFGDYERYDLYYVDNWSLLTDLAIVLKTVPAVLFRRGAY